MAQEKCSKFHIAMFPWFAMGHITPYLQLSNKLAEKGHQISFLLSNKARNQLNPINFHPNLINFHGLTVPHVEGLPPGVETASDIPIHLTTFLATAMDLMRDQVKELLQQLKPNLVFYDMAHWIPELASEIGFKTVSYNVVSAVAIAIALVPARKVTKNRDPITDDELMQPPLGYPSSTVVLRRHEAKSLSFINLEYGKGISFYDRITTNLKKCHAISIRTSRELEGSFCDYISREYEKPVFLTGPVLPQPEKQILEDRWEKWLTTFQPGTVVFCAFGSQIILEQKQYQELVLGFELTGLAFLIALKPPLGATTVEEALPEGFEDRIRGRGVVHGGWVQQPAILSHPSVGCFVNHCGFGSMWESLMSDSQIVLIPHLGDQILNTRLLVDELKVGVEVERDQNEWISKENICRAIKSVMDGDSEIAGLVKENHAKWRECIVKQCFLSECIETFIQNLYEL